MNRRSLLSTAGMALALAACAELPKVPVEVTVAIPEELKPVIEDVTAIVAKVESLGSSIPAVVTGLVDKAKGYIASLKAGLGDSKTIIKEIVAVVGGVAEKLPAPYGTIALAIETLLPVIGSAAGFRMAARRPTGMSAAQARMVLR